jgi:hypothetical protein
LIFSSQYLFNGQISPRGSKIPARSWQHDQVPGEGGGSDIVPRSCQRPERNVKLWKVLVGPLPPPPLPRLSVSISFSVLSRSEHLPPLSPSPHGRWGYAGRHGPAAQAATFCTGGVSYAHYISLLISELFCTNKYT